ncbi:hypothetical protein CJ739_1214 [Mariniflexile rhizosphaerae]|uniref:hypothetical protein n=1 Tax=unclassified Mariniflexile TaxID=2643887 RepID=UPI000CBEF971|nr:hypothetical protein [Mariniflexile sp. TRM1-10]AXP80305.1 hypothetical protein CJ739_1214 [Mariniflexile sp. TRM1-10]PLB20675.1 MAG: Cell well associated RhsD protein [Flavobacteriaceae bacterium FS1-H7996/R]
MLLKRIWLILVILQSIEKLANKGTTSILYNHLNLPKKVTFSGTNKFIDYIYDATGIKLKKKVTDGTSITETFYAPASPRIRYRSFSTSGGKSKQ